MIGLGFILLAIAAFGVFKASGVLSDGLLSDHIRVRGEVIARRDRPLRFARELLSAAVVLVAALYIGFLGFSFLMAT